MRPATPAELRAWDELVCANPDGGHYLQSRAWGEFKARWGWRPHHLVHEGEGESIAVLFLARLAPGLGTLWYAPKGPGVTTPQALAVMLPWRPPPRGAFLVKVEPEIRTGADTTTWLSSGLVKAPGEVQSNRATIVVNLRPGEDAVLASFKPKTRYNIRLAARHAVTVVDVVPDSAHAKVLYRLLQETNARNGIDVRPLAYFEEGWTRQGACGQGRLFFALHEGAVLAGAFVAHLGRRGWYKDGGSTRRDQQLMAPYLLQWEIMRWLRRQGVEDYDLVAVPRPSELTEAHPFAGLHRFKSGFNQEVIEYVGAWDWPVRPRASWVWNRAGERLARQWAARVHNDFFY
jgi:lipid II:glycine glycyltransferase (peptidoglycan interpeptide bridge formation enzyme)